MPEPIRAELLSSTDLKSSVEIDGRRVRYEVCTSNLAFQERLEHMGYRRDRQGQFIRDLSATGDVVAIHANHARHLEQMIRQSARLSPVHWEQGLSEFLSRVAGSSLQWFLYGSAALAVRGIDVDPGDLDFHVNDAYLAGRLFVDLLVEPVTEMTGWIADHGGRAFSGCIIEWIADIHPDVDQPVPHEQGAVAASRLESATWRGHQIPVAPLDLQLAVARRRDLHDRVAKIQRFTG